MSKKTLRVPLLKKQIQRKKIVDASLRLLKLRKKKRVCMADEGTQTYEVNKQFGRAATDKTNYYKQMRR